MGFLCAEGDVNLSIVQGASVAIREALATQRRLFESASALAATSHPELVLQCEVHAHVLLLCVVCSAALCVCGAEGDSVP